ncbi:hypothetical protein [Bartonella sp. HY038]|uniref:hypothetical protein n=1 Tax=Bartonella sp. HY038 TaxID=2759660 RepID=UPI00352D23B2
MTIIRHKAMIRRENKLSICSRILKQKISDVVRCFVVDLTGFQTSRLTGLNLNIINHIYQGLREPIYLACEA